MSNGRSLVQNVQRYMDGGSGPPEDGGFLMSLTDAQQEQLLADVAWIKLKLTDNLFTPGTAQGQKSVGSTIAATLAQSQSNYNAINKIPR